MKTETFKKGFTLAELLTAIVIIAILLGILLPALNMARNFAKVAKQKTLISSLDVGINMYKNDQGEYPQSHGNTNAVPPVADYAYYGAQTLAEAMVGCDLMGFHPKSEFKRTLNYGGGTTVYDAADDDNLVARKGLYIDRTNLGVFQTQDVYQKASPDLTDNAYVICDVFDAINEKITLPGGAPQDSPNKFKMGTPILYYRANTASLDIDTATTKNDRIYDYEDNEYITVDLGTVKNGTTKPHTDFTENTGTTNFLTYIEDPMASTATRNRPVRPDSYLLISAGPDGLYGTTDDICNFEPNFQ